MKAATETWLPVVGWEIYYEVSDLGRVRRRANSPARYKTEKVLSPKTCKREDNHKGYKQVTLKNDAMGAKTLYVHRLVCEAFHGASPTAQHQCCHNDGDPHNNHASNLRWDTRAANEADRILHGTHNRGERHGMSKLTDVQVLEIKELLSKGYSQRSVAKRFGVSQSCIYDIKTGKRWVWCIAPVGSVSPLVPTKQVF